MNISFKSRLISLILTILFGPLGLIYTSVLFSLMLILTLLTLLIPFNSWQPWLVVWTLSISIGDILVLAHNYKTNEIIHRTKKEKYS